MKTKKDLTIEDMQQHSAILYASIISMSNNIKMAQRLREKETDKQVMTYLDGNIDALSRVLNVIKSALPKDDE